VEQVEGSPIAIRRIIDHRKPVRIFGASFEAFQVEHSILAPAVGYKIRAGKACVFYAPDLVSIHGQCEALAGVDLYVGDGASIARPLVRRRGKSLIGHASIRDQIAWCSKERVPRAIFTHCGTQIVSGGDKKAREQVERMGHELGVKAELAQDGWETEV